MKNSRLADLLLLTAGFIFLCTLLVNLNPAMAADPDEWFDSHLDKHMELYRWLHSNPELSLCEEKTAAKIAQVWQELGFEITTNVGGHGVVAILDNGEGPTVMLRTDLDALPITEATPLPFASTVVAPNEDGTETGVMHACGHDIHMTNLTAVAGYLSDNRDKWKGTLMLIAQPAEEKGKGAKAMLDDGLFERFKKPDYALAMHVRSDRPTGNVVIRSGFSQANVDSVDITMIGRGGHGSAPETAIDPIVQAADLVMSLQMIVSREMDPQEPAVITVGSIHGGTKHNIIGDQCKLQLTVRSYGDESRQKLLAAIGRRAKGVAKTYGAPSPTLEFSEGTPSLKNDEKLAARMRILFSDLIGADHVEDGTPSMGGEDFSRYGIAGVPILMYSVGSVNANRLARFEKMEIPPPSLHSAAYYPDAPETLRISVKTMSAAAIDLLQ
ncbi:putative hydrolase YxeP [Rubripirellula obstinata]|uniref:Putative hydrolase YxeP n=1 Tax=Rubripirellula obstinata TaxID=406547 RepID=A0A5B1CM56_9BACT|nr:amidohydrolase [Rubripirellula obstinata]KAA1260869.1 putative hydrolase YxeP [Rubripirellula obstinata]